MILTLLLMLIGASLAQAQANPAYLGFEGPGEEPTVFAPGRISMPDQYEFGSVFSADGLEFFYGVDTGGDHGEIRGMRYENGSWSEPQRIIGDNRYSYNDPFLSPDEERLYFISSRPFDGTSEPKDIDIWFLERQGEGWSGPKPVEGEINSPRNEYYVSFTQDGSLYFSSNVAATDEHLRNFDIYVAPATPDGFGTPVVLEGGVNHPGYEADAFVAPNGSYLIFGSARREGLGKGDLYISFRAPDGSWLPAQNMGAPINSAGHELCPFVTHDGKYLFYTSNQDIHWVAASVIDAFAPKVGATE